MRVSYKFFQISIDRGPSDFHWFWCGISRIGITQETLSKGNRQKRRGWGAGGGQLPPLASEMRKFSEIQKFFGNSLSLWLLAQSTN